MQGVHMGRNSKADPAGTAARRKGNRFFHGRGGRDLNPGPGSGAISAFVVPPYCAAG